MDKDSIEALLDGDFVKEESECENLHEICDEYILSKISFYNFINLVETRDLLNCLDDFTFIKIIKKIAEDGLALDIFYEVEQSFNINYQKITFIKFLKEIELLFKEEKINRKVVEKILLNYAFIEYSSKRTNEEREKLVNKFLELINVSEVS